jgi:hypothetical protein
MIRMDSLALRWLDLSETAANDVSDDADLVPRFKYLQLTAGEDYWSWYRLRLVLQLEPSAKRQQLREWGCGILGHESFVFR